MKKHISKKARDRNFYFEIASIRIFSSYNPDVHSDNETTIVTKRRTISHN